MSQKRIIEFIESYRKDDDSGDYLYNDNHGELVRCKNCKHGEKINDGLVCRFYPIFKNPNGFCDKGEKRKQNGL